AQAQLNQLAERRADLRAPDAKGLAQLQRAIKERDEARVKLDASLVNVAWQVEGTWPIETLRADEPIGGTLQDSAEVNLRGSSGVAFRMPGVGTFRISGPSGSAEALRSRWEEAAENAEELLTKLGGQSLEQLQQNCGMAGGLQQQMDSLRTRIDAVLNRRSAE